MTRHRVTISFDIHALTEGDAKEQALEIIRELEKRFDNRPKLESLEVAEFGKWIDRETVIN